MSHWVKGLIRNLIRLKNGGYGGPRRARELSPRDAFEQTDRSDDAEPKRYGGDPVEGAGAGVVRESTTAGSEYLGCGRALVGAEAERRQEFVPPAIVLEQVAGTLDVPDLTELG